jgi:predicted GH43/DUF377 family glycosyl hydrolase
MKERIIKLKRFKYNPILLPNSKNEWESLHVSNAAATIYNGKIYILYRAEGKNEYRKSAPSWPVARIGLCISEDGYTIKERYSKPVIDLRGEELPQVDGVEDPRISKIGDTYFIVYVVTSIYGDHISLATTKDFKKFQKKGLIMPDISQRTSALLPEKINGQYLLYHRILPNIWVSYSKDLKTWYGSKIIMKRRFNHWTDVKIGICAPPIKLETAWVLFFHAKDSKGVYRLGIAWLDLKDPSKIIRVQDEPILEPEEEYERKGFVDNVVYSSGAVLLGDKVFVYYGCADRCLSVATVDKKEIELDK